MAGVAFGSDASRPRRRDVRAGTLPSFLFLVVTTLANCSDTLVAAAPAGPVRDPGFGSYAAPGDPGQHELLRFAVDLDAPPRSRRKAAIKEFLALRGAGPFLETYAAWQAKLEAFLPEYFGSPELTSATRAAWFQALEAAHPTAVAELEDLSRLLQHSLGGRREPLLEPPALAAVTALYVLGNALLGTRAGAGDLSACTSTLALASDGGLLHGRSLDYHPRDAMAATTAVIEYHSAGTLQYNCLEPLVYPTALQWFTCYRPGAFSLSVNARSQGVRMETGTSMAELLRRVRAPGSRLLGEVAAEAMQESSYEGALSTLVAANAVSSSYFILAGAHGAGALVTRFGNASAADVWTLGPGSPAEDGQPAWARVQTNVDHWVSFASGAYATHRRQAAVEALAAIGPERLDREGLLKVYLSRYARAGSANRTRHEDTGVILRPSTIATVILDPNEDGQFDARFWRVWNSTPTILPPRSSVEVPVGMQI